MFHQGNIVSGGKTGEAGTAGLPGLYSYRSASIVFWFAAFQAG